MEEAKAEAQEGQRAQQRTRVGLSEHTAAADSCHVTVQVSAGNVAGFGISHIWNHNTATSLHTCSLELDSRPQRGSWTVTIITVKGLDVVEGELRAKVVQGQIRHQEQQPKHIKMEMNTSM